MPHLIFLGDSIFDNARYVPDGPAVIDHARRGLPNGWKAALLAVDGSVASAIPEQLKRLPDDATHLVISTGGNDALLQAHTILPEPATSFAEVLATLQLVREDFRRRYQITLNAALETGRAVACCTIYDAIPGLESPLKAGVALYNDVITREAARFGVALIDLRNVCAEAGDYSPLSPIEPSASGGGKVARAVLRWALGEPGLTVYG